MSHHQGLSAARTQRGFHGVAGGPFAGSVRRKLVLSARVEFTSLPENVDSGKLTSLHFLNVFKKSGFIFHEHSFPFFSGTQCQGQC